MTAIPSGTKFVGIGASVPTPENKSSQNNAFQEVYTLEDLKDSVLDITTPPTEGDVLTYTSEGVAWEAPTGGSTTTTTVVNITSAQLKNIDNESVELLPALTGNQYYDIQDIILEFNYIAPFYSAGTLAISIGDNYRVINSNLIVTTSNQVVVLKDICVSSDIANRSVIGDSGNLTLSYDTNVPIDGNGTLRAIITYTVRTFGA